MNSYVQQPTRPTLVVPPTKSASKRRAVVENATECIDNLSDIFLADDDTYLDAVDIQPLEFISANPKDNIVFYVAGFVLRHCRKTFKCSVCIAGLSGEQNSLPQAALINIKLRGALQWPSETLFLSLREAEEFISSHLTKGADPETFNELLQQTLPAFLQLRPKLCNSHGSSVCAEIAVYYIITRLHWHVKQLNLNVKSTTSTKQHRKKAKLC